jgi:hypothetical protein
MAGRVGGQKKTYSQPDQVLEEASLFMGETETSPLLDMPFGAGLRYSDQIVYGSQKLALTES